MTIRLGIVMDPIESINPRKDSSLAMLLAAKRQGWELSYMLQKDIYIQDGVAYGRTRSLDVDDSVESWHSIGAEVATQRLDELDVILMRVDPPYDMEYIYTTYTLQRAAESGTLVVNRPDSLRLINEKLFTSWFSNLCPPTIISSQQSIIKEFLHSQDHIVVKPLDGMGGRSIFKISRGDLNTNTILETITNNNQTTVMAQRFIPEIEKGDKRILLIDGEAIPYALARIPGEGEFRGNLAAGGHGIGQPLSKQDQKICAQVGPVLRDKGIIFAGLDVIGDYLTEINVTSPTCIRELDKIYDLDIAGQLIDSLHDKIKSLKSDN